MTMTQQPASPLRLRFRLTGLIQEIKTKKDRTGRTTETFTVRLDHNALTALSREIPFHLALRENICVSKVIFAWDDLPLAKVTIAGSTGKKMGDLFSYLVMVDVNYKVRDEGLVRVDGVCVVGEGF